jgi:hypothetical protein
VHVPKTMVLAVGVPGGSFARLMIGVAMSHLDAIPLSRSAIRRVATDARASWRHPG